MFTGSHPFLLYDYFRVPYVVDAALLGSAACAIPMEHWGRIVASRAVAGPCLSWPLLREGEQAPAGALTPRRMRLRDLFLHGAVVPDAVIGPMLARSPGRWTAIEAVYANGARCASVWRSSTGSIVLPFDPDDIITSFWSEGYQALPAATAGNRVRNSLRDTYYLARPLLPRRVQIALRRTYSRVQRRTVFPRWPVERSLHAFYDLLLEWSSVVADAPVPRIASWPGGKAWALVLTHDVETASGVTNIPLLREPEQRLGYRSSWNFVPGRYSVDERLVRRLWDEGFEVGLHGLLHDGRDLDPRRLPRRLPQMRQYAEAWNAVGFRSPSTQRSWSTMSRLPFGYDSSYPDSDPFEPQPGGCCSWLPFLNGRLVELPITLPQDHTLFVILRAGDGRVWLDKIERIRSLGGMALLLTHPDYANTSPLTAAYEEVLSHFAGDPLVWHALPAAAADWWRRRAASCVVGDGGSWRVVGPAAEEASVDVTDPATHRAKEVWS